MIILIVSFLCLFFVLTKPKHFFKLGPEKGVIHIAVAAVVNAIWDLWARTEGKVGLSLVFLFE